MSEVAFISYANADTICDARILREFISKLRDEVYSHNLGVGRDDCVFFDTQSIQCAEDWEKRIALSVNRSKVLVAFCSPHFSASQFCGKEVSVFLQRFVNWERDNPSTTATCIITIIWHHEAKIPRQLQRYQFAKLPKNDTGQPIALRTLCKINKFSDTLETFVIDLADAIKTAHNLNVPPLGATPSFSDIASIFESPAPNRYGVAVIDLLGNEINISKELSQACAGTPYRFLDLSDGTAEAIAQAKAEREVVLVIAGSSVLSENRDPRLQAVDAAGGEQTGLVVISEKPFDLRDLRTAFPRGNAAFWETQIDTSNRTNFVEMLGEVITKLRARLIAEDPSKPASNEDILAKAHADGIPILRKPSIVGVGN
jgi:hypothetical protein